jgi:hypothetical protein
MSPSLQDPAECFSRQLDGQSVNPDVGGLIIGISSGFHVSSINDDLVITIPIDIVINTLLRE